MKNPNKRSAFTVAELVITMIVLAFLVFILLGFMNRDRQKEFDAKINKTSANLSGVVNKALLQKTGQYGADSQITPQEIYRDLIQGKDVFNIVETCTDNSCWGDELIGGENLDGKTKIVLNDGSAIAFGEKDIFIDANGLKKPNVMGKDVRKWNGEYRRQDVVKTTAVCAAPKIPNGSTCCNPLAANEVWTSTSGCDKCTSNKWRNNTCCSTTNDSNPKNSQWNSSGCDYTCNTPSDGNTRISDAKTCKTCSKTSTQVWTSATGCGTCDRGTKPGNSYWNSDYSCDWTCNGTSVYNKKSGNCEQPPAVCPEWDADMFRMDSTWNKVVEIPFNQTNCVCKVHPVTYNGGRGYKGNIYINGVAHYFNGSCNHPNDAGCKKVDVKAGDTIQRAPGGTAVTGESSFERGFFTVECYSKSRWNNIINSNNWGAQ